MDAIIVYWSKTGNTEKVALAIQEGLEGGVDVLLNVVNYPAASCGVVH